MSVDLLADSARWFLVLAFLLALGEKGLVLARRATSWHPVIVVSSWRRRHAGLLITSALLADAVSVVLLLLRPSLGAACAIGLVIVYSASAWKARLDADGCRCFLGLLDASSRRAMLLRNGCLASFGLMVVGWSPSDTWEGLVGGALLLASMAALMGRRVPSSRQLADFASAQYGVEGSED